MGRPKKDSGAPGARESIVEAFWNLLQDNQLHEVSIGMIAAASGYNRGTFYYHFVDKDTLVSAAVEEELADVPRNIFALISGVGADEGAVSLVDGHMGRLALFMDHGGRNIVERKVKDYLIGMWTALLTPQNGELEPATLIILEYMSSGMLGLVSCLGMMGEGQNADFPADFLKAFSSLALDHICEIQGISRDEIVMRLRMLNQLSKVNQL